MSLEPLAGLVGLILALPSFSAAQARAFDLTKIRLGTDSMTISIVRHGDTTVIGQLWDDLGIPLGIPSSRLRRVYRTTNQVFGAHLETTFVSVPTLALVRRRTRSVSYADSVEVDGSVATGWVQSASALSISISRTLPTGTIDASLYDVAVRTAPLALGYSLTLKGYSSLQDSILTLNATVVAVEVVSQRDGRQRRTWRVQVHFDELVSTMWIDQETRALVKQIIELGSGVHMLLLR